MSFEGFNEKITDPRVIFESIAESLADDQGYELKVLSEDTDFIEMELYDVSESAPHTRMRVRNEFVQIFLGGLLEILEEEHPQIAWRDCVSLGEKEYPFPSIVIDYKIARGEEAKDI